jgi:hypothetical protein
VHSAQVIELGTARRSVDLVLILSRGQERYARHVEFQARHRADLARRCFEYATRLVVQLQMPVLTTVVYVRPPGPRELVFRESLGTSVLHERRFEVVRLWETEAGEVLSLGPGGAALVGLARGADLGEIEKASRTIRRSAPEAQQGDLLAILQALCEGRYTARQLARVIPEEVVMGSSIFDRATERGIEQGLRQGLRQGLQRGRVEGRLEEARQLCAAFVKRHHAGVAARVLPAIQACSDPSRLHRWALQVPDLSAEEVLRLIRPTVAPRATRHRTARPARRSRRATAR